MFLCLSYIDMYIVTYIWLWINFRFTVIFGIIKLLQDLSSNIGYFSVTPFQPPIALNIKFPNWECNILLPTLCINYRLTNKSPIVIWVLRVSSNASGSLAMLASIKSLSLLGLSWLSRIGFCTLLPILLWDDL